jgi:hypothetical protein
MSQNVLMVSSEVLTAPRACAVLAPTRALVPSLPDADATRKRWIWSLPSSRGACASVEIRLRFSGRNKLWFVSMKSTPSWYVVWHWWFDVNMCDLEVFKTNMLFLLCHPVFCFTFCRTQSWSTWASQTQWRWEIARESLENQKFILCIESIRGYNLEVYVSQTRGGNHRKLSMYPRGCVIRNCCSGS